MKIRIEYRKHITYPIFIWYPYGKGESFEELTIEDAKTFRYQLSKAITKAESLGYQYECLICNPTIRFNTSKDKGHDRLHMTSTHARTLKWALEKGKVRRIENE